MLLKNILHHWISKKNHSKKNDKPQGALPLGRKGRYGFSAYVATVLCVGCLSTTAFAASDPLTVVNNLSTFVFSLIRAIGLILLGWAWCRWVSPSRAMTPPSVPRAFSPWLAAWS